ncbi:acetylxylan esterase [Cupriavidus basilensis]
MARSAAISIRGDRSRTGAASSAIFESLDGVDQHRIGIWGTSYAGGHAMVLGATDARIRVVAAQVPIVSGYEQSLRRVPPDARAAQQAMFNEDERAQLRGEPPMLQRVVSLDPAVRAVYRSKDMMEFHDAFEIPDGVEHSESVTIRSSRLSCRCMSLGSGFRASGRSRC